MTIKPFRVSFGHVFMIQTRKLLKRTSISSIGIDISIRKRCNPPLEILLILITLSIADRLSLGVICEIAGSALRKIKGHVVSRQRMSMREPAEHQRPGDVFWNALQGMGFFSLETFHKGFSFLSNMAPERNVCVRVRVCVCVCEGKFPLFSADQGPLSRNLRKSAGRFAHESPSY